METRACRVIIVLGILVGSLAASPVTAQPSEVTVQGVVEGDIVEGLVSRADPQARTITLDNGQQVDIHLDENFEVLGQEAEGNEVED